MWKCINCNELNKDDFELCWNCKVGKDSTKPEHPKEYEKSKNNLTNSKSQQIKTSISKQNLFAILGFILGIPLSYYFQSGTVQSKLSLSKYLSNLIKLIDKGGSEMALPLILSCIIFAVIGGVIGYFVDQNEAKKESNS